MGADSKIEWCAHTFNAWIGCHKVSPACDHCYAETFVSNRMGRPELWQGMRHRTSENNWKLPLRWNRTAERSGTRARVFCASLADVFDNQVPSVWRDDLWRLIDETSHLDWLLLTKRPQNIAHMIPKHGGRPWPWSNVLLGTTVENQPEANRRLRHLLNVPAARYFVSYEPALGPFDPTDVEIGVGADAKANALRGWWGGARKGGLTRIDWIICGGESGAGARPMDPAWARALRDQCQGAGVPFFMKQMGGPVKARMPEIPADLMVREFPAP